MNKKGFFMSLPLDMIGWMLFFVGMITWLIVFSLLSSDIRYDLNKEGSINDKSNLIAILETDSNGMTIADRIISVNADSDALLKKDLDKILNSVYGRDRKVCWSLWKYKDGDQKNIGEVPCNSKKEILFDQEIDLANPGDKPLRIRLAVLGYTE